MYRIVTSPVTRMERKAREVLWRRGMDKKFKWAYARAFGGYGITSPIVVHQMAKVGSTSVFQALERLWLSVPVYHTHALHELDIVEARVRETKKDLSDLALIEQYREIRQRIDRWRGGPWSLVSLVRDPVSRDVSDFFDAIPDFMPDFYERVRRGELDVPRICDLFATVGGGRFVRDPSPWFDGQVRDPFGIDVYATPFPKEAGYAIYEGNRVRLLLLRLESLDTCATDAFRRFLNIPKFRPCQANDSEDKPYREIYRRFKQEAILPESYLDQQYGCRLARHFYSDEELRRFKHRWQRNRVDSGRSVVSMQ